MRFLIYWALVFLTVLQPLACFAALTDFDRQEIPFENLLAKYNSGFESGKANWTASGGTFTAVTSGTNLLNGKGSATWDASASGQTLTSQAVTIPKGYYGLDCEVEILAQVPSGTATHYVRAYDGTNVQAYQTIVSSTTPRWNPVTFPCPQSGTIALQIYANADEPLIAIDVGYIGRSKRVGSTQLISEWTSYTPTGTWSSNTTYTGQWRRVGDSLEMRAKLALSGAPTSATLSVNLPSAANCTIDTNKIPTTVADYVPILGEGIARDNGTAYYNINVVYNNTTSVLPITKKVSGSYISQEAITQAAPFTFGNTDAIEFSARVPCVGWAGQTVVMPDAQGWWAGANISGANVSLGTSAQSSYVELTNASLSMTQKSGSATAWIPCSSTNAATGTTCSSGNEGLGIVVTIPKTGVYRACAQFAHYVDSPAGSVNVESVFQLVQTAVNSQTILQEGGGKQYSGEVSLSGDRRSGKPLNVCGTFTLSAGQTAIRLMYEQDVGGTPDNNYIPADASGTYGQRDFDIVIYPIQNQSNALLANSVSTGTVNGEKIERAKLNLSGATTVSITNQSTGWLSSVTASGTVATVNFTSGWFSAEPTCQVTCSTSTANVFGVANPNGTTSINVACIDVTSAVRTSNAIAVTCIGPR